MAGYAELLASLRTASFMLSTLLKFDLLYCQTVMESLHCLNEHRRKTLEPSDRQLRRTASIVAAVFLVQCSAYSMIGQDD